MLPPAPFSISLEYVFAQPVRYAGVDYPAGAFVPKGTIPARDLAMFADQRLIIERAPDAVPVDPVPVSSNSPAPRIAPASEPTSPYSVKNKGFGRFYVVDAGQNNVAGPYRSEEAADEARRALLAA